MSRTETAKIAEDIHGSKLYQQRARKAFPILVRQAYAGKTISYSDLAEELNIHHRSLNFVLGCIGNTLKNISTKWNEKIPPIQCLVVNKNTAIPGDGISEFLGKEDFSQLSIRDKKIIVNHHLADIYIYRKWHEVLAILSLSSIDTNIPDIGKQYSFIAGGGEGKEHRILKNYIANNPQIVDLPKSVRGEIEYPLLSGDSLDVSFQYKSEWVAVEVKSKISNENDIVRGLFQCVKYLAVMEATQNFKGQRQSNSHVVLALGSCFPQSLVPLRNLLGIHVIENIEAG